MIPVSMPEASGQFGATDHRDSRSSYDRPFPSPLPSPHVLVIDADLSALDSLNRLFYCQGFSVTLSSILLDVDLIHALKPDVILLDMSPEMDRRSSEILQTLLLDPDFGWIPLVCTTSDTRVARQLARCGIRTLIKPFRPFDLFTAIDLVRTRHDGSLPVAGGR